ncbi:peptidoglycan DD-metalloendopeptidase family protein [Paraburkholderia caribensis]|uniref:peptidoglycan DD-metalloendopeptidase family protein n=1 Tax=Paraburkholderia caribensis TaxID=75105 RepID=UPI001591BE58|nr:peptidoglycan DD-metalloendopeptidase family protein [Paraburkholderia caribensis]
MLISYPIITADADIGDLTRDIAYSNQLFPEPPFGSGAYPLSANMRWHGGVHLRYGMEPIRSIADGTVAFVRAAEAKNTNDKDPLNYGSADGQATNWTDNGCVVIEHHAETGEKTSLAFWSVYMHLSAVSVKQGQTVDRKTVVGRGGEISGFQAIHFEIFTNQAGIDALFKRGDKPYKVFDSTVQAGDPDLWGDSHFIVRAGIDVYDQSPEMAKIKHRAWESDKAKHDHAERKRIADVLKQARQHHQHVDAATTKAQPYGVSEPSMTCNKIGTTDRLLNVTVTFSRGACRTTSYDETGDVVDHADCPDARYEYNMNQIANLIDPASASAAYELLRWGRVIGPDALQTSKAGNWKYIAFDSGKKGYIDLNDKIIVKLSDADFPEFLGWKLVHEGGKGTSAMPDGRCDAKTVLKLLKENVDDSMTDQRALSRLRDDGVRKKMRRLVCEFRTEWEAENFDAAYGFLLKDGTWGDHTPRTAMTQDQYAQFKAHANKLQWWADAKLSLPPTLWHFHPIEFIDWMRKCAWIDKSTLAKIYKRTPEATRERYRVALNQVMQKYVITNPIRQAHFFGQGAVESGSLTNMQEASMANGKINPASQQSEADLGHWYGRETPEFDSYYSSEKFNSKGGRIAGSYSWSNGNVGDTDAQEFRGRGFKQLTGRSNYAGYWVYRSWLKASDFDDHWWDDPAYKRHQPAQMKLRPAPINDPDRIITNPYNCIDSGGFYITFKRPNVKPEIDAGSGKLPVTPEQNAAAKQISSAVTYAINGGHIDELRRYEETMNALKVLN